MKTRFILSLSLAGAMVVAGCGQAPTQRSSSTTSIAPATPARARPLRAKQPPEEMLLRLVHDRDLDSTQEKTLVRIRDGLRAQRAALATLDAQTKTKLLQELATPSPEAARLEAIAAISIEARRKMAHAVTDDVLALLSTFTPEQKAAFVAHASPQRVTREEVRADLVAQVAAAKSSTPLEPIASSSHVVSPDVAALAAIDPKSLSSAQAAVWKVWRKQVRKATRARDEVVEALRATVLAELAKPSPDATAVHATIDRALAPLATSTHASLATALQLQSTLTPEQRSAIAFPQKIRGEKS